MKIDIVLISSNENPLYYTFYPYIKKFWEKVLGVKCLLVYIGYSLPDVLKDFSDDIIIFEPIQNINTAFIAQNIRLLYPCLLTNYSNGILISDIDMIPLSSNYFIDKIINYPDNSFINYTWEPINIDIKQYYMCYNVANYNTWREIFGINSTQDIIDTLTKWYNKINYHFDERYRSKCTGFCNDQYMLYKYVNFWNSQCLINNINVLEKQDESLVLINRTIYNIYEFNDNIDVITLNPRLILLSRDTRRLIADNKSFRKNLINNTIKKIKNCDDFHMPKNFYKDYLHNILDVLYN